MTGRLKVCMDTMNMYLMSLMQQNYTCFSACSNLFIQFIYLDELDPGQETSIGNVKPYFL